MPVITTVGPMLHVLSETDDEELGFAVSEPSEDVQHGEAFAFLKRFAIRWLNDPYGRLPDQRW